MTTSTQSQQKTTKANIARPLKSAEALSASPYCKGRWLEEPEGIFQEEKDVDLENKHDIHFVLNLRQHAQMP